MAQPWHTRTAHEIAAAVQTGDTTAVEVTRNALDRIDRVDSQVKAFIDVWRESALERAAAIDKDLAAGGVAGPLAGVPVALKDVLCTRQGTTTCCSRILEEYRSPFDATVVERLEQAGAVFLGKANMDEFAMGSSTENSARQLTRNPYNREYVPGGSSGGSAAAVCADECALAFGSDTGGSIRQPAALCGCIGMKPTYGRVSRYGLVAFASSLDQIGPFTKDVEDMALVLNVICGHDPKDSTSASMAVPDFTSALRDDAKGLRVGIPREYFTDALGDEMRDRIETATDALRSAGAELVNVSLPHTDYAVAVYYIICTAEASANLARFDGVRYGYRAPDVKDVRDMYHRSRSEGFGTEVQRRILLGTYVLSSGYYDAYYLKAQKVRSLIRRDFLDAFQECDVIAAPTTPTAAFRFGEKVEDPLEMYLSDIFTISVNLAGIPGASVPCGLTNAGLPTGLQLLARPFDEAAIVAAASAYERNRGFEIPRPPLDT